VQSTHLVIEQVGIFPCRGSEAPCSTLRPVLVRPRVTVNLGRRTERAPRSVRAIWKLALRTASYGLAIPSPTRFYRLGTMANSFASITVGRECRPQGEHLMRHRHARGYAAVVLAGGYEEAGERARLRVQAGDVIVHGAFEAHRNRIGRAGAEILNIELPDTVEPQAPLARIRDLDELVRTAQREPAAALECLLQLLLPAPPPTVLDWPDQLAQDLIADPCLRLGNWADAQHLSVGTLSRGFHQVYGISPAAFRWQVRARRAWQHIRSSTQSLVEVAAAAGFADQAHMTRAVRIITGQPAGAWRRTAS
jgi:AraC-like DNA-binding protein